MAREDLSVHNYDPNQVYSAGAKDGQGHSTNIRAHIPDSWIGAIQELVASPDWPEYKTFQHFYRDAIYHRMRWAASQPNRLNSPRVKTLIALAQGEAALNYAGLARASSQSYVEKAKRVLGELMGDNNRVAVKETLKELESTLEFLDEPWRGELAREISSYDRRVHGL